VVSTKKKKEDGENGDKKEEKEDKKFRDPCVTSFAGRFGDSFGYLAHDTFLGVTSEGMHLAEMAGDTAVAGTVAVVASQAARTGYWPGFLADFGEVGMLGATKHVFHKAGPYGLAAAGGLLVAAGVDAYTSNGGCK
jgi:hypothetical protein